MWSVSSHIHKKKDYENTLICSYTVNNVYLSTTIFLLLNSLKNDLLCLKTYIRFFAIN